ncbi:outer membrane beta-barrel protein [Allomuricauda sp. NBRC 101325]|uniref:outer membrane beta-barrel protein n=1 Tax=Allomuricauda sp. NBRC 101325 TaxID=1113758 RepID=UPI0024A23F2B|nr:outer membrane beta-barrel protein [Muricauda sp. NBRC 101325]GLU45299.1 hypothetical protein Musp01_29230 [Muricauda sp. NBRC 101325]
MKHPVNLVLVLFLSIGIFQTYAQSIEVSASYGYQFGTKLNYGRNYLKIKDSDQYHITAGYDMGYVGAEISYTRMGSELRMRDVNYTNGEERLSDIAVDLIQVTGLKYFGNDNIKPFLGGGLGLAILSPSNENRDLTDRDLSSSTKFAFSAKGGVKMLLAPRLGIILQGHLFFPVEWGGLYVGVGPGGPSTGVSVSTTTIIGALSGGFFLKLN